MCIYLCLCNTPVSLSMHLTDCMPKFLKQELTYTLNFSYTDLGNSGTLQHLCRYYHFSFSLVRLFSKSNKIFLIPYHLTSNEQCFFLSFLRLSTTNSKFFNCSSFSRFSFMSDTPHLSHLRRPTQSSRPSMVLYSLLFNSVPFIL